MKKIFKRAVVTATIVGIVTGVVAPPKAEAGLSLGDIGKGLLSVLGSGGDINTANKRMLDNFSYSMKLLAGAYQNVQIATNDSIANKSLITQDQALKSAVKPTDAGLQMKNGMEQSKADAEKMKNYLSEALASGDEAKLAEIDSFIKTANQQRTLSDFMAGVAYAQIAVISAAQIKTIASGGNSEEKTNALANIVAIAIETKALLSVRKEMSNIVKTATAEYRRARGIKDPSKKEQKAAAAEIEKG